MYKPFTVSAKALSYESPVVPTDARKFAASKRLVCQRHSKIDPFYLTNGKVKLTPEIRERAVQLLIESEKDYPSTWAAITAIAPKIGCTPETLRVWYLKHMDQLNPAKVQQISDQEKMKQMEREIKELKRANEILRKAAAFFAQAELDRPHK